MSEKLNNKEREILEKLKKIFYKRLEAKTSWGKNMVRGEFEISLLHLEHKEEEEYDFEPFKNIDNKIDLKPKHDFDKDGFDERFDFDSERPPWE